jgi:hypothetical protein
MIQSSELNNRKRTLSSLFESEESGPMKRVKTFPSGDEGGTDLGEVFSKNKSMKNIFVKLIEKNSPLVSLRFSGSTMKQNRTQPGSSGLYMLPPGQKSSLVLPSLLSSGK